MARLKLQARVRASIILALTTILGLIIYGGLPFRIAYAIFCGLAWHELLCIIDGKLYALKHINISGLEFLLLFISAFYMVFTKTFNIVLLIAGVVVTDAGAYFIGHAIGGKIIKKRPFPKVSPSKSWEGILGGVALASLVVSTILVSFPHAKSDWLYLLCSPFAVIGDALESYTKRLFYVKDSCEETSNKVVICLCNFFMGGKDGHGGFLDRLDSMAFASSCMLLLSLITR